MASRSYGVSGLVPWVTRYEALRSLSTKDDGHVRNHELLPLDLKWTEPTDLEENRYICRLDKLRWMLNNLA